jgi:large subunit ribosomal protein L13
MKTYSAKPSDIKRKWYILDASEASLGRVSTLAANLLLGKHKPMFTQHIDVGDYVVIINADNLKLSGNKLENKIYYHHSGYPGGLKKITAKDKIAKDDARFLIKHSIRGMLPNNKLLDDRLKRLKVYGGSEHPHDPQQPAIISLRKEK